MHTTGCARGIKPPRRATRAAAELAATSSGELARLLYCGLMGAIAEAVRFDMERSLRGVGGGKDKICRVVHHVL